MQQSIAHRNYAHVFTSAEIALSKKFKANVLYDPRFLGCFSFLAFDKISLFEE